MIRNQLNSFIESEEDNVLQFKIESMKSSLITISILEMQEFQIKFNNDMSISVDSEDEQLKKHFLGPVNEFCKGKKRIDMRELLEECTTIYGEMPDDDEDMGEDNMEDEGEDWGDDDSDVQLDTNIDIEEGMFDAYDDVLLSPTASRQAEQKRKMIADHLNKKVQETDKKMQIGDTIRQMKGTANSDWSKKADKDIHLTFYTDGFTIDDGPLRGLQDPKEQNLLNSLKAGFVPTELSGSARDIDVHVHWEDVTYEEKKKRTIEKKQKEQNDVDDLYFQQQLAQIAEMEAREAAKKGTSSGQTKPTPKPAQNPTSQTSGQGQTTGRQLGGNTVPVNPYRQSPPVQPVQPKPVQPVQPVQPAQPKPHQSPEKEPEKKPFEDSTGRALGTQESQSNQGGFKKSSAPFNYTPSNDQPITTIQFRIGGERVRQQFNSSSQVGVVVQFVAQHAQCPDSFKLSMAYPRRDITNTNQSIKDAGLENASLNVTPC